jgi:hypothetical protein
MRLPFAVTFTLAPEDVRGKHGGMASANAGRRIRLLGLLVMIAGIILVVAGAATYVTVSMKLSDQEITVSDDAGHFAGQKVTQPWQAYAQADVIAEHATEIAGGKTYAQLPEDDPSRQTVMIASFLQASLFTSVVAFGLAAMAFGLGVVFVVAGWALRSLGDAVANDLSQGRPSSTTPDGFATGSDPQPGRS